MAVYTTISDDELAGLLARYDLGTLLSFQGIAEGVENSNYLLRTDKANYILTLFEKRTNKEDLPFFMGLTEHLAQKGIICPSPIHDNEGQILQMVAGKPAAIVSFLDGVSHKVPNAVQCRALGETLARMHLASADFEMSRQNALGPQGWQPLLSSIEPQETSLPDNLKEMAQDKLDTILAQWPDNLPSGVIHADLFPNNVMFIGVQLTGVFDFYFACSDAFAYDLSICLNSWCFEQDGSFNITKSAAMIEGYQSMRPLNEAEMNALPILCRGSAMRFFLTRYYDWINTPKDAFVKPHDPMEYWSKLRFHEKCTSLSSYGIWS